MLCLRLLFTTVRWELMRTFYERGGDATPRTAADDFPDLACRKRPPASAVERLRNGICTYPGACHTTCGVCGILGLDDTMSKEISASRIRVIQ